MAHGTSQVSWEPRPKYSYTWSDNPTQAPAEGDNVEEDSASSFLKVSKFREKWCSPAKARRIPVKFTEELLLLGEEQKKMSSIQKVGLNMLQNQKQLFEQTGGDSVNMEALVLRVETKVVSLLLAL